MAHSFERLQAAAIDGRAHNVYYRQTQLERLCKILISSADEILETIKADYGHSQAEIAVEFNLAISVIRQNYASLQPTKALEEEYSIADGKNAETKNVPVGIVYIEPTSHTLFYSVIGPLSAAVATGNCVIVLLENSLKTAPNLLRRLFQSALDSETFAIASSPVKDKNLLGAAVFVNQNRGDLYPKANELVSLRSRTIAVVDRTADIELAARELLTARFAFGGSSAYAPDLVLVNEFVKKDFLQAVVSECVKLGSGVGMSISFSKFSGSGKVQEKVNALRKMDSELRVVLQENKFAVADLPTRLQQIPSDKVDAPVLVVYGMRSLDDAIDLLGRSSATPYLAGYYFSNLPNGKYLSQFVDSEASFVNHVPRELLVGPAYPTLHPVRPGKPYPLALFSRPRPAFAKPTAESSPLAAALSSPTNTAAQKLLASAIAPLAVMKRSEGGGVGFFEQGFLMNASLILTTAVTLSGVGAWYLWRWSRPRG